MALWFGGLREALREVQVWDAECLELKIQRGARVQGLGFRGGGRELLSVRSLWLLNSLGV